MKFWIGIKVVAGTLCLVLGAIGLFLPVWPTTPFVLLAVGCFASTPRLRAKLLQIGFVREYYESYTTGQGIGRKTLVRSLCFLWGMLLLSCVLVKLLWVRLLLMAIGAAVTVHLVWMARKRRCVVTTNPNTEK